MRIVGRGEVTHSLSFLTAWSSFVSRQHWLKYCTQIVHIFESESLLVCFICFDVQLEERTLVSIVVHTRAVLFPGKGTVETGWAPEPV